MSRNRFIFAFVLFTWAILVEWPMLSQTRRSIVSGYVRDADTGGTLPGAGVVGSKGATVTNAYGFFSLPIESPGDSLSFSFVGYGASVHHFPATRDTTVNISLFPGEALQGAVVSAGTRGRAGKISLTPAEILSNPVVFSEPDVLKSLQVLPGVQGGMEGTAGILVRGGGPDENLFLMDGVPVYNVSHLLGIFSAFTPEAVKNVTLYKGAFPARFGGRVSSVVDLRTNDGDLQSWHGTASIGILNSRLHLDGPIVKGKTTVSLTGRGMNTFFLLPFLGKMGSNYSYFFYDANAKIVHRFTERDHLQATFYACRDDFSYLSDPYLSEDQEEGRYLAQDGTDMDWGNMLASLKWNHVFNSKLFASTSFSWYGYDTYTKLRQLRTSLENKLEDRSVFHSDVKDYILNSDLDYMLSPSHTIHAGVSGTWHVFAPSTEAANKVLAISVSEKDAATRVYSGLEASVYAEDEMLIWKILHADIGFRYTLMTSGKKVYHSLEPRVSFLADITGHLGVSASYARMSQYVHLLSMSQVTLPTDMWIPVTDRVRPVISDQVSLGANYSANGWEASLEGYYKHSDGVLEYKNGVSFLSGSKDWGEMVEMGEAVSRGMELLLKKDSGLFRGWLSYTLSWTDRRFRDGSINGGRWYPSQYDRRHVLSLNLSYRFNKAWDISAGWSFASGSKMTLPQRRILTGYGFLQNYDQKNNVTLPPSHHLDLSLNWTRQFKHGRRVWNLSVYNVYNAMNPNMVRVGYWKGKDGTDHFGAKALTYLPILPSMSYTYMF